MTSRSREDDFLFGRQVYTQPSAATAVPEPSTLALLSVLLAAYGIGALRRRAAGHAV